VGIAPNLRMFLINICRLGCIRILGLIYSLINNRKYMVFGIVLVIMGSMMLLKALGLIPGFQWDLVLAAFLLGIGITMIWKRTR